MDSSAQSRRSKSLALLVVAVLVVLVIFGAAALRAGRSGGGGGGSPNPCASPHMPALGRGLRCAPGGAGSFAWLTTATPTASGVAPPAGLAALKRYVASDAACVTESACQSYCLDDSACSFYAYDSSKQRGTAKCPAAGSVCATFGGGVPAALAAGRTPYVSGGIPAGLLPRG